MKKNSNTNLTKEKHKCFDLSQITNNQNSIIPVDLSTFSEKNRLGKIIHGVSICVK